MSEQKEKVILAYSGGLDTTAIIPWLKENYDFDVICVCINTAELPNCIFWMSMMSSPRSISFPAYRPTPFTRTSISWAPPWPVL